LKLLLNLKGVVINEFINAVKSADINTEEVKKLMLKTGKD
jgi:hypothetical protein